MTRPPKVIISVVLLVAAAGLAGFAVFLHGQGLSRADSWVTVVGFFVSALLGLASAVFGYLAWQHPGSAAAGTATAVVGRSGPIVQRNSGGVNVANTGVSGVVRLPDDRR